MPLSHYMLIEFRMFSRYYQLLSTPSRNSRYRQASIKRSVKLVHYTVMFGYIHMYYNHETETIHPVEFRGGYMSMSDAKMALSQVDKKAHSSRDDLVDVSRTFHYIRSRLLKNFYTWMAITYTAGRTCCGREDGGFKMFGVKHSITIFETYAEAVQSLSNFECCMTDCCGLIEGVLDIQLSQDWKLWSVKLYLQ